MGSLTDTEFYKQEKARDRALLSPALGAQENIPDGMFKSITGEYKPRFTKQDLADLDQKYIADKLVVAQEKVRQNEIAAAQLSPEEQDAQEMDQILQATKNADYGALPEQIPMQQNPEPQIPQMSGNPNMPPNQSSAGALPAEDFSQPPREMVSATPGEGKAVGFSEEQPKPEDVMQIIKSPAGVDAAKKSASVISTAGNEIQAADIVKANGGKSGIEKQVKDITKDMPKDVQKSIWDLTTQQKGAWLMDFGLRLMAASDRPGTSLGGAVGRAGMGTISAMKGEEAAKQKGALSAEQTAYDREQDRLKLEQGDKRIEASKSNIARQYRATDTEKYRARQLEAIRKEFPDMKEDQSGFLADKLTDSRVLIRDLMKRPAKAMADLEEEIRKDGYTVTMPDGRAKKLNSKKAMEYFNANPEAKKKIIKKRVRVALTGNEELYDFALRIKNSGLSDIKAIEVIDQQTDGALPKAAITEAVKSVEDDEPKDKLNIRQYLN